MNEAYANDPIWISLLTCGRSCYDEYDCPYFAKRITTTTEERE